MRGHSSRTVQIILTNISPDPMFQFEGLDSLTSNQLLLIIPQKLSEVQLVEFKGDRY